MAQTTATDGATGQSTTDSRKASLMLDTALGTSGLVQYGGYINEEFLKELKGQKGARTYREMADNDPIIGAVIFACSMLLRQVDWSVVAADDSEESLVAKEFVESVLADMETPMSDVIDEVSSMFTYGFAPMEIVWKRRDGMDEEGLIHESFADGAIGIRSIALRAQPTIQRWEFDEAGKVLGAWQQPLSGTMIFIPMEKMLNFRTTVQRGNPEGRSLLRNAYRPWFFKKRIEEFEGIGVERDLAGLPVARVPGELFDVNADANQKATLAMWQQLVRNIRNDRQVGVLIPSDTDQQGKPLYDLTLLSTGGSRTFDTTKIVDRYDKRIATTVLADFIFLGQSAVGSFALSSDKTALFAAALGGFMQSIKSVFNRHLLPRLWRYNGFDPAVMPTLDHGDIEHANIAEITGLLTAMTGAGAALFPDPELENFIRNMAGLPDAPEDGVDMRTPPPGFQPPGDGQDQGGDGKGQTGAGARAGPA